jgi:PAS domain S-box-containing protein
MPLLETVVERLPAPVRAIRQNWVIAYGLALAIIAIATLVRFETVGTLTAPFVPFFVAALATAFLGGLGPGIFAILLSALSGWYFLSPPSHSFPLGDHETVRLLLFVLIASVCVGLVAEAQKRFLADVEAGQLLREVGSRCIREGSDFGGCLNAILWTATMVTGAPKGNIQLFDKNSGALTIAAQRGFEPPFLKFFAQMPSEDSAHGKALNAFDRVVVEDVRRSEVLASKPALTVMLDAQVLAFHVTPLMSSSGTIMGMVSMHYSAPHRPSKRELRWINLLARQAADYLERKEIEEKLRARNEELESLFRLVPIPVWIADDAECQNVRRNRAASDLLGVSESHNFLHAGGEGRAVPIWRRRDGHRLLRDELPLQRAAASGQPQHENEIDVQTLDGRTVTMSGNAVPIFDSGGTVRGAIAALADITEIRRAEEKLQRLADERLVLMNELSHRVNNTLAVVQALATQTFRGRGGNPLKVFETRLLALARAHRLLTAERWQGGSLRQVVTRALEPFTSSRITAKGPDIKLSPKRTLGLSMALFELGTNAAKYGALSADTGRVRIAWSVVPGKDGAALKFTWAEEDGPAVETPTRTGFGSRIIEKALAADFGGKVAVNYHADGLVVNLMAPVELGSVAPLVALGDGDDLFVKREAL